MRYTMLVLLLFFAPYACLGKGSSSESLNRYVTKAMDRNHVPSIAALRVTDRGATEAAFWGYANIENEEAPTADTAYLLASVSKLFVATAIMQLEERGLLSLDDDVNKLLHVDFPSIRNPSHPNVPITVRQLLTHTASIRDDWNVIDESYVFDAVDPEISLQAFTKEYFTPSKAKAYRAKHPPGTDYAYANMGYELLGVIVENVSGTSFEQFTQTNIFKPLGMDPASWLIEGLLDSGASIAMPYRWSKRKQKFVEYGHYTFSGSPDGGLRTSVNGLGAFVKMVLNDGVSASTGKRILKASTLNKMLRQATPVENWQGLGWYESEVDGGGVWGHGGAEQGVSTMLMLDRRRGRGVVVLTNGDDAFGGDDDYEMLEMFWDCVRNYEPLAQRGNCPRCGMIRFDSHLHGAGRRPALTVLRNAPITHKSVVRAAQYAADQLPEVNTTLQTSQRVHHFVRGESTGSSGQKSLLGGKGANLCEMARIGLNVPPGLVISTTVCQEFHDAGKKLPPGLMEEVTAALKRVETTTGRVFGDTTRAPLLLSVRSGAAVSMPGMMDTVLNLGLNDETLPVMAAEHGWRLALDCYRRLLDMFGDVVCGISHDLFEKEMAAVKEAAGITYDIDMSEADLRAVIDRFKKVYKREGKSMPTDPYEQLEMAVAAVFGSWNTARAVKYRELNHITGLIGTAVNIQSMVFGNLNENSATGVCFTRNPATGEPGLYGEFLVNAQGEDVVAGIRTPLPVKDMAVPFPDAYTQLVDNAANLERHFSDMQDIEFTVQDGQLYILQTRNGKRTGAAALRVAVDLKNEGLVTQDEAVLMVEPRHLEQLMHPVFENPVGSHAYKSAVMAKGLPASPGAACGQIVFTAEAAERWKSEGKPVVLVRTETSPEDVGGMHAAVGIFTSRGGMTSHAAVVARGWGKPCVCGCEKLDVCQESKTATIGKNTLAEGDWISLNGTTGEVLLGKQPTKKAELSDQLAEFMSWADAARRLGVMANCDTPKDAAIARANGAAGIGLVRTEHMFFSSAERIKAVRRMIAAEELDSKDESNEALANLKDFQKEDFKGIFRAMDGLEVTIRLLDPPLHEFLPKEGPELSSLCDDLLKSYHAKPAGQHMRAHKLLLRRLEGLNETNPMMGLRGCRLGIVHPDITAMQAAAIIEAAVECQAEGVAVNPAIMIPLVGFEEELVNQLRVVRDVAEKIFNDSNNSNRGSRIDIKVGTMIEVPRAALISAQLAQHCDFFSVGSNDLTQMTLGFSRDDAEAKFMSEYIKEGIIPHDPFDSLDVTGVGELIKLAVERGRSTKPNLRIGICGEHGGDPKSISFVNGADLDYVSCSPLRVPVARLAAAQAEIKALASMANDHCQD